MSMHALKEFLSMTLKLRQINEDVGVALNIPKTDYEFTLEHGRPMEKRAKLDDDLVFEHSNQCYHNAWAMKNRRRAQKLRYCEGYVLIEGVPIPVHHGWLLNEKNEVVDPSVNQSKNAWYYGLEFEDQYAKDFWAKLKVKKLIGIMPNLHVFRLKQEEELTKGLVK